MSVRRLREIIGKARLVASDETWFPRWVAQYAIRLKLADDQVVPVDYDRVVDFLKTLKSDGKVAWQRLQAVRAIEFYARSVREITAPELAPIGRNGGTGANGRNFRNCHAGPGRTN